MENHDKHEVTSDKRKQFKSLVGERFGRLTVISLTDKRVGKDRVWQCKCDCGTVKDIAGRNLKRGFSKSCGCYKQEVFLDMATTHGKSGSKLYHIRKGMIRRTTVPEDERYAYYGAKGVKVCDEWLDEEKGLDNFCNWATNNGYEDGLTIERIDYNGNYEPSNCKWATPLEQGSNKSNNVYHTFNGETFTATEWSRRLGGNVNLVTKRLKAGWSLEKALTSPVKKYKNKGVE